MKRFGWIIRMALRDLRRSHIRLLLFVFVLSVGVAAIVGLRSFRANLDDAVDRESRALLGADMVITSRSKPNAEVTAFLEAIPGKKLRSVYLTTMASLGESLRLVQLRAIERGFPFYGEFEMEPRGSLDTIFEGAGALVDETLLAQTGVSVGGEIVIGGKSFRVTGKLIRVPGEVLGFSLVAPRVYIARSEIEKLPLLGQGSQSRYKWFYLSAADTIPFVNANGSLFKKFRLEREVAAERREGVGRTIERVSQFLTIAGLASLLLGGVGIMSGTAVYLRGKRESAVILRTLGASRRAIRSIYMTQVLLLSLGGCLAGVLLGIAVQLVLPSMFAAFLPLGASFTVSFRSIGEGIVAGIVVSLVFSLLPLARFWTEQRHSRRLLLPRVLVTRFPFAIAQGIRSLSRPGNQTTAVVIALGTGLGIILGIILSESALKREFDTASAPSQANVVLFDVQRDQLQAIRSFLTDRELAVVDEAPIVPMRLVSLKGRPLSEALRDREIPAWTLRREYRSTYRNRLADTERVVSGNFPGNKRGDGVPVSVEYGIAKDLGIGVGDGIVFDVQGVEIRAYVSSLREVNWKRVRPNFFIVFPPGVLEDAPQFFALTTKVSDLSASATFQKALVSRFPNVAIIDLRATIESVDAVLGKIRQASRFMALFTVAVGLIVLCSATAASAYERVAEGALLKVLGATRHTVRFVVLSEFFALGTAAAFLSLALGWLFAWGTTKYVLKIPLVTEVQLFSGIVLFPVIIGVLGMVVSSSAYRKPPLEVLRDD